MSSNNDLLEKLVLDTHKNMAIMMSDIAAIKVDVKEHMRRTAILEVENKFNRKHIYYVQGAIGLIGVFGTVLKIFHYF